MNAPEDPIIPCYNFLRPVPDTYVIRKSADADDDERCYICFEGWKIGDDMSVLDGQCPTCRISLSSFNAEVVLRDAAAVGDIEKVKQLLEQKICHSTRDYYGRTPLHLATLHGHEAVIEVLLDNGSDTSLVDYKQQTPLHLAASQFSPTIVVVLVQRGADLDACDKEGMTPLHLAFQRGIDEITDYLLEKGADPEARNSYGCTPRMLHPHSLFSRFPMLLF
uniref:GA-binding protein beta chain n=1 Tax=Coccidioides posadasii RMSCC 3488 TaxID=454284 RepID=A0A0J6FHH5_COCPO|nr:GA-binding protein beta chain [Coccidioides posadasii RMSCC 3488]